MEKAQLTIALLTALTPTVAVFIATLIQRQDVRDLRTEMVNLRNQVHADLLMIHERVARVEARQGN
jgi:type II secretory pathway component PulK